MAKQEQSVAHPYIPNAEPGMRKKMLEEIGAASVEEFYADIPEKLRFKGKLDLPPAHLSEFGLKRHVEGILNKNDSCSENLSFLGGGCYQHHVPAICDEVNRRSEFLTAYAGEPYEDHGRFQTLWEYCSMMGELLEMDVVNVPTYDGLQAAATSLRMAVRVTGRKEIILAGAVGPDRLSRIVDYAKPHINVVQIPCDAASGLVDVDAVTNALSKNAAAVYFESPSYLGGIETAGARLTELAHQKGALSVVGVDPSSLGVLAPPASYGADIVCGDIQPLGMHIQYGGGHAGFIASADDERIVMEYPSRLFGIAPTTVEGEYGFGDVAFDRTSFGVREEGKEWVGTAAALLGITAGVYLATMGPQGMRELGEGCMQRAQYAAQELAKIDGVELVFNATPFKEFVLRFTGSKSVEEINAALRQKKIFGGHALEKDYPSLENCALYCVTEIHSQADIDSLVTAVKEAVA
jgi:glycine dehydrogenase subunit 1